MNCENCAARAETRYVTFNQNIGLFVVRFPSQVQGYFCKNCIHYFFWKMTLTSLVAGWWGIISFFVNIAFVFGNVAEYLYCLPMRPPAQDQKTDQVDPELAPFAEERIAKFQDQILMALKSGADMESLYREISDKAIAPIDQVMLYVDKHQLVKRAEG